MWIVGANMLEIEVEFKAVDLLYGWTQEEE